MVTSANQTPEQSANSALGDSSDGAAPIRAIALEQHEVQNSVRQAGINPNFWYAVAWSSQLAAGQVLGVEVWQQKIALYRDRSGAVQALEDACPHRGVELSRGKVMGDHLACRYHGWEFDGAGQCRKIPYLPPSQKLPCAQAQSYRAVDRYGIIWVFPGDQSLADQMPLPEIPEFDDPQWLAVPVTGQFRAHFSVCNENSMDVFHGFLHEELQGWFDPVLLKLKDEGNAIVADYQVSYKGQMAKFLGFTESADQVTTKTVTVQYRYPHFFSRLEGVSSLYLMRLPVGLRESRSFAIFFLRLGLPGWLVQVLRPWAAKLIEQKIFMRFLNQDIEMMESEQRAIDLDPQRRYVEINPAIIAVQRMILRQYQQFLNGKAKPSR